MGKFKVTTDQGSYFVTTDDSPSAGMGFIQQHPFQSMFQPAMKTMTGDTLQNMAFNASQMPIPQAQSRPFDANIPNALNQNMRIGTQALASTIGGIGDTLTTPSSYAIPLGLKVVGKMLPTIYNDKLIADTTQSAIAKIKGAVDPLRKAYSSLNQPFANQIVDGETFQNALNVVPKSIQKDFIDEYGTKVVDAKGNPQTTVGNLQKMELELKDFIKQPKFGQKINAQDFNTGQAAQQLKQIRLSQLPQDTQAAIQALDKQFGPVVNMSNELLPKLASPNGKPNSRFLFNTFKNPADASTRQYLSDLKNVGADLSPEINIIKGWVARQGLKGFVKGTGNKIAEGGAIGTALSVLKGGG